MEERMPGRESEYFRGYLRGVSAMMNLISSDKVKRLDKSNVLLYARELVEQQRLLEGGHE
jgi:small nuclear ribonucleoprotein (snRNP)-like protein